MVESCGEGGESAVLIGQGCSSLTRKIACDRILE
jgi:hypothetical protein